MTFGYYLFFHLHISINIKSNETQGFPDNKRVSSLHKPLTFNYYLFISIPISEPRLDVNPTESTC